MMRPFLFRLLTAIALTAAPAAAFAVDSYRYLHVTIDTPWYIFLFLLPIVVSPFILMAILYWRFAIRKSDEREGSGNKES